MLSSILFSTYYSYSPCSKCIINLLIVSCSYSFMLHKRHDTLTDPASSASRPSASRHTTASAWQAVPHPRPVQVGQDVSATAQGAQGAQQAWPTCTCQLPSYLCPARPSLLKSELLLFMIS